MNHLFSKGNKSCSIDVPLSTKETQPPVGKLETSRTHLQNMATSRKLLIKPYGRTSNKCRKWIALFLANVFLVLSIWAFMATSSNGKPVRQLMRNRKGKMDVSALRSRNDWNAGETPEFCGQIKAFPQPLRKNCSTAPEIKGAPKCDPHRPMMFGQYGEDYYLYTRHFSKYKKPGVYLDIATNNPIQISNTYFMDRCLSWKGICVEANPKYFEAIHRERSCALVPTCISQDDGVVVEFALSGPGSGILATHRQGKNFLKQKKPVVRQKCVSVPSQLERYGVTEIDYLNLDVEGHELEVLKSFDWDNVKVKVISVEISPVSAEPIQEFLEMNGFVKHDNEQPTGKMEGMPIYESNHFYVHNSVTFGKP